MIVYKIIENQDDFCAIHENELQTGDLFFTANDVFFTCENGEFYLDFQIREKRLDGAPIVDAGGVTLISEYWKQQKNDADFDNGAPVDLFGFLFDTVQDVLNYSGLTSFYIWNNAKKALKKYLWYFE